MFIRFVEGIQTPYTFRSRHSASSVEPVQGVHHTLATTHDSDTDSAATPDGSHRSANPYLRHALRQPAPRTRISTVGEIMAAPVHSLPPHTLLREAHEIFRTQRYRHIPIIDSSGNLQGIVSDRDILRQLAGSNREGVWETRLERFMVRDVLVSREETDIRTAARVLFEERIGCLPVCNGNGSVVGILTRSDILRALIQNAPLELWL